LRSRTRLLLSGKSATGVQVPAEIVEKLGSSERPAAVVTIEGHQYRSTVASMGGKFMIPVRAEHRASAGAAGGNEVEADIKLDTKPRDVDVPVDFLRALDEYMDARRNFEALSYRGKRRFVLTILQAKIPRTRERRVAKAIMMLREG
jgi:Bacteriocin-protection, YdeI or OmpD-Associated/Domain of unknown function (DUF1905)